MSCDHPGFERQRNRLWILNGKMVSYHVLSANVDLTLENESISRSLPIFQGALLTLELLSLCSTESHENSSSQRALLPSLLPKVQFSTSVLRLFPWETSWSFPSLFSVVNCFRADIKQVSRGYSFVAKIPASLESRELLQRQLLGCLSSGLTSQESPSQGWLWKPSTVRGIQALPCFLCVHGCMISLQSFLF